MHKCIKYIFSCLLLYIGANNLVAQTDPIDSLKQVGNYSEALRLYNLALEAHTKAGNTKEQIKDYNNIANVYSDMGNYEKSTQLYFKAIKLAELSNDAKTQATIYYNIANNYFNASKPNYSIDFLNKAIKTISTEKNNELLLGTCYNMLGGISTDEKKYDEGLIYLQKAEKLFTNIKQNDWLANVYVNIAFIGLEKPDYKMAVEYSLKSIEIFKIEKDNIGVSVGYINLQKAIFHLADTGKILNKSITLHALMLLDSAQTALKNIASPETQIKIYEYKQYLYSRLKQYDSAFFYQSKFLDLNNTIHNIEKNKQLDELKIQYEVEKKEKENILLQKQRQRRGYIVIILLLVLGAVILAGILVLRLNKLRAKQKTIQMEQQLLRLQMNPHFLFNAINSIQNFILKKSQQEAYDYLAKFAKLIRIVLNNSQEKTLSLQQELEMIQLYIELEQLRFNNSFEFNLTVHKEVNEIEISVPPMLIQPYIENAIWHGLMNLENERKGILNVGITQDNDVLRICIIDNGIGRVKAREYKKEDSYKSVGMALTEQRLLMINKMQEYENAKVIVTDLYFNDGKAAGTRVEIFIPINGK